MPRLEEVYPGRLDYVPHSSSPFSWHDPEELARLCDLLKAGNRAWREIHDEDMESLADACREHSAAQTKIFNLECDLAITRSNLRVATNVNLALAFVLGVLIVIVLALT